jgi:hypothetical protein
MLNLGDQLTVAITIQPAPATVPAEDINLLRRTHENSSPMDHLILVEKKKPTNRTPSNFQLSCTPSDLLISRTQSRRSDSSDYTNFAFRE